MIENLQQKQHCWQRMNAEHQTQSEGDPGKVFCRVASACVSSHEDHMAAGNWCPLKMLTLPGTDISKTTKKKTTHTHTHKTKHTNSKAGTGNINLVLTIPLNINHKIYKYGNHSPKSSHTHTLSLSPKGNKQCLHDQLFSDHSSSPMIFDMALKSSHSVTTCFLSLTKIQSGPWYKICCTRYVCYSPETSG